MSTKTKHNIAWLTIVVAIIAWTILMIHVSGTSAMQSYHELQRGKAMMMSNVLSEVVISNRFLKTNSKETPYNQHDILKRLADKVLFSVAGDPTVDWVAVLDQDGYVPWAWSLNKKNGITDGLISPQLLELVKESETQNILYEDGSTVVSANILQANRQKWGYIIIGYRQQVDHQQKVIRENAVTSILAFAIIATGLYGPVRKRFWRH